VHALGVLACGIPASKLGLFRPPGGWGSSGPLGAGVLPVVWCLDFLRSLGASAGGLPLCCAQELSRAQLKLREAQEEVEEARTAGAEPCPDPSPEAAPQCQALKEWKVSPCAVLCRLGPHQTQPAVPGARMPALLRCLQCRPTTQVLLSTKPRGMGTKPPYLWWDPVAPGRDTSAVHRAQSCRRLEVHRGGPCPDDWLSCSASCSRGVALRCPSASPSTHPREQPRWAPEQAPHSLTCNAGAQSDLHCHTPYQLRAMGPNKETGHHGSCVHAAKCDLLWLPLAVRGAAPGPSWVPLHQEALDERGVQWQRYQCRSFDCVLRRRREGGQGSARCCPRVGASGRAVSAASISLRRPGAGGPRRGEPSPWMRPWR